MSTPFDMRVFVRVVDRGSFSAAGKDLGLTPSAVSKLVSRLEDRLGTRLLHRTTRRLALTPEGEIYNLRARDILGAIEDAETEVTRAGTTPRGRLRVNMGTAFMLHALARALPDFLARYPEIGRAVGHRPAGRPAPRELRRRHPHRPDRRSLADRARLRAQ